MAKSTFPQKLLFTVLLVANAAITSLESEDLLQLKCLLGVSKGAFFGGVGVLMIFLTGVALLTSLAIQREEHTFDPLITAVASIYLNYRAVVILADAFNKEPDRNLVIAMIVTSILALALGAFANKRFKDQYLAFVLGQCYLLLFVAAAIGVVGFLVNKIGGAVDLKKECFIINPGVAMAIVALPYLIVSMFTFCCKIPRGYIIVIYGLFTVAVAVFAPDTINGCALVVPGKELKVIISSGYALAFFAVLEWLRARKPSMDNEKKYWGWFIGALTAAGAIVGLLLYALTASNKHNIGSVVLVHAMGTLMTASLILAFDYYFHNKVLVQMSLTPDPDATTSG